MKATKIIKKLKKRLNTTNITTPPITPKRVFYIWEKNTLTKVETFTI